MRMLSLSDVEARLTQIADEVDRTHERVTVTRDGRPYLVLMSPEDLNSVEATLELLTDAAAWRRVEQAGQDLDAGRGTSGEHMAALMSARRDEGSA